MLYYKTKEFTRLSQTGFWREGKNVFFFRNGRFMSSNKITFVAVMLMHMASKNVADLSSDVPAVHVRSISFAVPSS
jgi:hypothetical protein